ncbi:MAG: methylated-DNA--[protein]-cysteine S-methyltransferase [Flavobacteriales bacterium]|nr:methylated-DNA--[protein]-cysteine S-methyltransferase [Flavobacteriales bacterium]
MAMQQERDGTLSGLFGRMYVVAVEGPIGKIWMESDGALITRSSFEVISGRNAKAPKVLLEAARQMDQYFKRRRKNFELPLQLHGTQFRELVRERLLAIPYGQTTTYGTIARTIGGKAIARTVGQACATNPLPILVPCHRVIAGNGLLTGYVGGLWRKQGLLELEGAIPPNLFPRRHMR